LERELLLWALGGIQKEDGKSRGEARWWAFDWARKGWGGRDRIGLNPGGLASRGS
jgi:hypothetical protein